MRRWRSRKARSSKRVFADHELWQGHLKRVGITQERHRRIATEGALLGSVLHHGCPEDLAIVSDDAGQFNVLCQGLCWVAHSQAHSAQWPLPTIIRQQATPQ